MDYIIPKEKECVGCNTPYMSYNSTNKYCNACKNRRCPICNGKINRTGQTFCSKKCSSENKKRRANRKNEEKRQQTKCLICGEIVKSYKSKTCSSSCASLLAYETMKKACLGGEGECKKCGNTFLKIRKRDAYCLECTNKPCKICGKPVGSGRSDMCSRKCVSAYIKKECLEKYREFAKVLHTEEAKRKSGINRKGRPNPKNRGPNYKLRGKNNIMWRGGRQKGRKKFMDRFEYKNAREATYNRDDYTCQICLKRGGNIVAHHIRSFNYYPELRLDINNLVTLCNQCHKEVHRRGGGTHGEVDTFSIIFRMIHEL